MTATKYLVQDVTYGVHQKHGASALAPKTMRVVYDIGYGKYQSEWVAFEHGGHARQRAIEWWQRRSNLLVPMTAAQAVMIANRGGLARTLAITVEQAPDERYGTIVDHELAPPHVV